MGADAMSGWISRFPSLADVEDPLLRSSLSAVRVMQLPSGATVFRSGDPCRNYLLVLEGSVRVQKVSESGREILLYRVESGQSCILTTACLLAGEDYAAEAVTETPVRAVAIPLSLFHEAMGASRPFREFVFRAYAERITSLILLVEAVAFGRMDVRLARCLLERAGDGTEVNTTHQDLATELGTAREVISRLLKEFERTGLVHLQRGRVILDNTAELRRIASGAGGNAP